MATAQLQELCCKIYILKCGYQIVASVCGATDLESLCTHLASTMPLFLPGSSNRLHLGQLLEQGPLATLPRGVYKLQDLVDSQQDYQR